MITINQYDLLLMLHPAVEPERQTEILDRLRNTVESAQGTIVAIDDWGKKKLTYEINHQTEGVYVDVVFHAEPTTLTEVERVLGITDDVMRFMTIRAERQQSAKPSASPATA